MQAQELSSFIDTHFSIKAADGQNLQRKTTEKSIDTVALKALIQDLIWHSESAQPADYFSIQEKPDLMRTSNSIFPVESDLQNSQYGENECIFLESAGILVRNPSNHGQFRLVDFF